MKMKTSIFIFPFSIFYFLFCGGEKCANGRRSGRTKDLISLLSRIHCNLQSPAKLLLPLASAECRGGAYPAHVLPVTCLRSLSHSPYCSNLKNMTADTIDLTSLQDEIDSLAAQITKQGGEVRTLKKNSSSDADAIGEAVKALQILKIGHKELLVKMEGASGGKDTFNRQIFDELILRKMFVVPSFEIHGGVKGLFDLGPPACALKVRKNLERYRYSRDLFYIDMFTHFADIIYLQGGNA